MQESVRSAGRLVLDVSVPDEAFFFCFFFASYCIIFLLFAAFVFLKLTGRLCLNICNFYLNCAFIGVDILCCCSK